MCSKGRINLYVLLVFVLVGLVAFCYYVYQYEVTHYHPTGPRVKPTLRLAVVISRHGNRAPFKTHHKFPFPSDNKKYWPFGPSQLTLQGRLKMYNLGIKIRALYNGFLDEYYYKEHFKAYSTATERTLMSAELFLAGLFPPKGYQQWSDKLMWQPIPVYHNEWDHSQDAEKLCQRYKEDFASNYAKYNTQEKHNDTIFLEGIAPYTALEEESNDVGTLIYLLGDCMMSAYDEGLPLPAWAQERYPQILDQQVRIYSFFKSFNLLKFMEGPLFQQITQLMEEKLSGKTEDQKMYYFSGHDKTVFGLKMILGIPVTTIINTGSSLILELHEDLQTGTHFIEVVYIDGKTPNFELSTINIPGCEYPCYLNVVKNLTKQFCDFTDYIEDCKV